MKNWYMNQAISRALSKYCLTPCQLITQHNFLQRHISCVWITLEITVGTLLIVSLLETAKKHGGVRETLSLSSRSDDLTSTLLGENSRFLTFFGFFSFFLKLNISLNTSPFTTQLILPTAGGCPGSCWDRWVGHIAHFKLRVMKTLQVLLVF